MQRIIKYKTTNKNTNLNLEDTTMKTTATKTAKTNAENYGVFGYTTIDTTSANALSNNWQNWHELRRELQGKPINTDTILKAMHKVDFAKHGAVGIHSFYPDAGKCYVGLENGKFASVCISWDVTQQSNEALLNEIKELKALVSKLVNRK